MPMELAPLPAALVDLVRLDRVLCARDLVTARVRARVRARARARVNIRVRVRVTAK